MTTDAPRLFAVNLRRAMKRAKLSQRAVAERAGTKHPNVNRILGGKQTPGLELAGRLADAAGVPLADLFRAAAK